MPYSVLVVEDDADIRDTLVEVLTEKGYPARGAANGQLALDALAADAPPELIVLDLMMPIMDGRTFRAHQLANPAFASIPVLLMSAYHDVAQQAKALGLDYVAKPISIAPLLSVVQRIARPQRRLAQ